MEYATQKLVIGLICAEITAYVLYRIMNKDYPIADLSQIRSMIYPFLLPLYLCFFVLRLYLLEVHNIYLP